MIGCPHKRTGLTLVELLVVIVILTLLVAVVLPLAQPTPSQRVVREAARQVNAFLASAQARSMAEERAYGVLLVPNTNGEQCFDLMLAKVPPVYAGDEITATADISATNANEATLNDANRIVTSLNDDPTADGENLFVGEGDRIRFNYRGPWYRIEIISVSSPDQVAITYNSDVDGDGSNDAPLPPPGAQYKYQIRRKPRASAAGTMTLPTGAYVDLGYFDATNGFQPVSGEGDSSPLSSELIMFDSSGRPKSDSTYLLVGATQPQVASTQKDAWLNGVRNLLVDTPGIWITINGSTGRISTAENVAQVSIGPMASSATVALSDGTFRTYDLMDNVDRIAAWNAAVATSRASAVSGPTMGGR